MTVSVVISTYNDGKYLADCVKSVMSQDLAISEIIIVDDGSTDEDSIAYLKSLANSIPGLKIVVQSNSGPAAARNTGLRVALGDLIAFVDSDDRLREDCLEKRYELMRNKPATVAAYGGFSAFYPDGSTSLSQFEEIRDCQPRSCNIGKPNRFPGGLPLYLFRTKALREVQGLDESLVLLEDFDLILRILRKGSLISGTNEPTYFRTIRYDSYSRGSARRALWGTIAFLLKARRERYFGNMEIGKRLGFAIWQYCRFSLRSISGFSR